MAGLYGPGGTLKVAAVCLVVAAASLLVPASPGYDAWSWLIWGREISQGTLEMAEGPAWKPLPVAIDVMLSAFGSAAPELWLLVARIGALAALVLAWRVAVRLSGLRAAGALASAGVLLSGDFLQHAAVGDSEPLLVALVLGAIDRLLDGRHEQALALGGLAALLRPESWPFLLLYAAWLWREQSRLRPALTVGALAIPACWFLPELLATGELGRSAQRATTPNPGAPATAARPALAALELAATQVLFLPLVAAALLSRGPTAILAGAGFSWLLLVAAMSEMGFSGEARYAVPAAALLAVGGAAATTTAFSRARRGVRPRVADSRRRISGSWVALGRPFMAVALAVATALMAVVRLGELGDLGPRLEHQAKLERDLAGIVAQAGGPEALLACGRPVTGPFRGPLAAWQLEIHKHQVDFVPASDTVVLSSRLTPASGVAPSAGERDAMVLRHGEWTLAAPRSCALPYRASR